MNINDEDNSETKEFTMRVKNKIKMMMEMKNIIIIKLMMMRIKKCWMK